MSAYAMPLSGLPGSGAAGRLLRARKTRAGNSERAAFSATAKPQPDGEQLPLQPAPAGAELAPGALGASVAWTPPTWDEVVQEHSARVFRLAYRLTGNKHDAEDLTQEVFVRVFRSLNSYTPGTFEGWLHRITTNLFLDQMRRKQRIRFDSLPEDADDRMPGNEVGPERAWEHNHLDHDVQRALDSLSPDFRAAVVLCDIEGLSYEEIAVTLGIKLGTVRSRIHRGRAQLRERLAHRRPDVGADQHAHDGFGREASR